MYEVDGKVLVYANENAMIFMNKFVQFFEAISLSPNEMDKRGGWITYIYFPEFTYSGGNRNSDSNSFYRLAKSNNKEVVHFFRNIEPLETQGLYGIVVKELSNFTINDGINTYSIKEIYKDGDYIIVHPRKGENNNMYFESSKIGYGGKDKLDDSNFIHLETNGANRYAFPVKGLVASFPFSLFYTLDELVMIKK